MQTHSDYDASFMERLRDRAEESKKRGDGRITSGAPGEQPLCAWKHNSVHVTHMPDDEQGIVRISVGGLLRSPMAFEYCTIRGTVGECIAMLEHAIAALKAAP